MRSSYAGPLATIGLVTGLAGLWWASAQSPLQVGYGVYTADSGSRPPVGMALFRVVNTAGVITSEAAVGATEPIRAGRIFVDDVGTWTGVALVNANSTAASIVFTLRNSAGAEVGRKTHSLAANQHLAFYVTDLFATEAVRLRGSLSFESSQPLAAVTLRESRNGQGEPLYTTLPVVSLAATPSTQSVTFPHVAAGGGFTTELLLMNPTTEEMRGELVLYGSDGQLLSLQGEGQTVSRVPYVIAGNGTFRTALDSPTLHAGWAVAVPAAGSKAPSGSAIFQWKANNHVVGEAGVAATGLIKAGRTFVDNAQTQTALAIANPSSSTANLTLTLLDRDGNMQDIQNRTLPAGNHIAFYANELFSSVTEGFTGLIEIQSDVDVAAVTLKLTVNSRGDLIVTTLPVASLTSLSTQRTLIFPQIAIGGQFSTRLILINPDKSTASSGRLNFYQSDGVNMVLPLGSETGSQFLYRVSAGSGRQLYPGNSARVAAISVIDPLDGRPTTEITINEGNTVRPRLRITDSAGEFRDDFDVTIRSLETTVATVDAAGNVRGERAGFSTLTIASQGVLATATATVVQVNSGSAGFGVQGIVQDLANRLYLAASSEHAILLAEDLRQTPVTYAGVRRSPGLKNGARLESQFRNPAFLAFDQARGTLFVSDGANNVIRRVTAGSSGTVETLAGTGTAGGQDGALAQASFNNPQGLALDGRGNLWVADSGNHTIRRINLQNGTVETIAGMAGAPGLADGRGQDARFRGLVGLAPESESIVRQLERERRGEPAPPVRILVADTGNGVVRRVTEDGQVETLGTANVSAIQAAAAKSSSAVETPPNTPFRFNAPVAIAIDPFDNVFVTETGSGQVKTLLHTGNIVTAVQSRTFSSPSGISIRESGKLVVGDASRMTQELVYAPPAITSITPDHIGLLPGEVVTIHGQNLAPDSVVTIGTFIIADLTVDDSHTITFRTPTLPMGRNTVSVRHRGGVAQDSVIVEAPGLNDIPAGYVTTVVGGSTDGRDGSIASSATIVEPGTLAVDNSGNLFVVERILNRIRRIDSITKIITTFAGTGQFRFSGDGGPAAAADLALPVGFAIDRRGNFLIADTENHRIRKVDVATKLITTIAGTGRPGFSGDNGPAVLANLASPTAVTTDSIGNIFIIDTTNHRIRKIDASSSVITTIAGNGIQGYSGDNGPATQASLNLDPVYSPKGLATDAADNLFFAEPENLVVRKVDARTGVITTIAGTGKTSFPIGDGGPAVSASLWFPIGISFDTAGNLLIADEWQSRIRKLKAASGTIETVAGAGGYGFSGDDGLAPLALLRGPRGIVSDAAGNFFLSDALNHRVRRVDAKTGVITTIAGTGQAVPSSEGEPARVTSLLGPVSLAMDANARLLIADGPDHKVRRVDLQSGTITTIAGTGIAGYSGNIGRAVDSMLSGPEALAVDPFGDILIAEPNNQVIRKVSSSSGTLSRIAGIAGRRGFSGDGGMAIQASFDLKGVQQLATDSKGNIFIPDSGNHRIRRIDYETGIITTFVGNGFGEFSGDDGSATSAALNRPAAVAFDSAGNLYISDTFNNRIRRVSAQTGVINTVAGTGRLGGFRGDGGLAVAALLNSPTAITFDSAGNLFFTDQFGSRVRRVSTATGIITTVAGRDGQGYSGDGSPAVNALFTGMVGIVFDRSGNLYIADGANHRIRAIRGPIP